MIAEAAASVPILLYDGAHEIEDHPLLRLIAAPTPTTTRADLLEAFFGHLLVSDSAYLEATALNGELRELHILRPDRIQIVPGSDGYAEAYDYTVEGLSPVRLDGEAIPGVRRVLHQKLFHPLNDHYGFSPIEAASTAIDIHNAATRWNKALLDNSARPSGALVYTSRDGNLTTEQYDRLKSEYGPAPTQQKFNPGQARKPSGNPGGGPWTKPGGESGEGNAPITGADGDENDPNSDDHHLPDVSDLDDFKDDPNDVPVAKRPSIPTTLPAPKANVKTPKSGVSGAEAAKDVPSWAKGDRPLVGEDGKAFAKGLLDAKYGAGKYDTGPT